MIRQAEEFVNQYLVQHELRKRILKRFKQDGIEIPYPIRTVYMKNVDAESNGLPFGKMITPAGMKPLPFIHESGENGLIGKG